MVISLLAAKNKAGSALFQAAAVVFLASLYDMPLSLSALGGLFLAVVVEEVTVGRKRR